MTLHATREGETVTVNITYGPVSASVVEQEGHARSFWGQLGNLLHTPEDRARNGYERYRDHADGVSKFTGDALPSFDEVDDDIRGHWIAAFTE
jgi:hypothetical protein